jgi:uncharacterized protein (TIGR02391 family)
MSAPEAKLVMSFDPKTIDHLGIKMYSQLPSAMAELIANAYDADASKVRIALNDDSEKEIIVADDGIGMTFDELNEKFLRIGRNRREAGETRTAKGRIATGKKGLGKLAFFGIGNVITVTTCKEGSRVEFCLDWEALKGTPPGQDYEPEFQIGECSPEDHGTVVALHRLKRQSNFDEEALALSLAKLFHFPDGDFVVEVSRNGGEAVTVTNRLKYEGIDSEFEWPIPDGAPPQESDYAQQKDITGKIITAKKPLRAELRGITLFANGRMVNAPEYFSPSESSHFYSYATGWLDVDFVDSWTEDVIATNRQALDWEHPSTQILRNHLRGLIAAIHQDWRAKRKAARRVGASQRAKVSLSDWFSKVPAEIEAKLSTVVNMVVDESELPESAQGEVIEALHSLVPEYPHYHWRHLHPEIQDAAENDYQRKDYYRAFTEAAKRFISKTRETSASTNSSDSGMMGEVYGRSSTISVTAMFKKPNGSDFPADTLNGIEDGQKFMSMGIVAGGRNPVSHEEIVDLRDSGLFTEKDCLDGLSLLSHLMARLESSQVATSPP